MYDTHSIQSIMPTQLERSRKAAERYAILSALRESTGSRSRSTARWGVPTSTRPPGTQTRQRVARGWFPAGEFRRWSRNRTNELVRGGR
jgi:hypothetical protein